MKKLLAVLVLVLSAGIASAQQKSKFADVSWFILFQYENVILGFDPKSLTVVSPQDEFSVDMIGVYRHPRDIDGFVARASVLELHISCKRKEAKFFDDVFLDIDGNEGPKGTLSKYDVWGKVEDISVPGHLINTVCNRISPLISPRALR